jgi:small basic protein (TIGR04137 family)
MSMDRSLKSKSTLVRHRNVLTRAERVQHLKEVGRWTESSSTKGLPKVAHRKLTVGKKTKAEKKPAAEGEAAAPAAEEKKTAKE